MGAETGIAWTDSTWNPWWGCQRVSPGCEHCYAESWDARWKGGHWGPQSPRRFFGDAHWNEPRKWNREAEKACVRRRVFCASMADVFEDRRDLDGQRLRLLNLIMETPHLDWQILTKRPENIGSVWPEPWRAYTNVWLGTTVEDQQRANERIPHLLRTPAAVRFLSCEPLLEAVDLTHLAAGPFGMLDALRGGSWGWPRTTDFVNHSDIGSVAWVIVGGESGGGARPMDPAWARSLVGQCKAAGVPCFVKQLGGAHDKRGEPAFWPEDLRVRQFPEPRS